MGVKALVIFILSTGLTVMLLAGLIFGYTRGDTNAMLASLLILVPVALLWASLIFQVRGR